MARRGGKKVGADPERAYIRYSFYIALFLLAAATSYVVGLNAEGQMGADTATYLTSITLSFMFPVIAFSYMLMTGKRLRTIISEFGLSRDKLTSGALIDGVKIFLVIFLLEIAIAAFSVASGIALPTNTQLLLNGAPVYFLLFGIFITPFNEETLFRGLMVPRMGIVLSAVIFALLHSGYASISEFIGALVFGLVAGYVFKKRGSLYSTMFAHFLVNLLAILQYLL